MALAGSRSYTSRALLWTGLLLASSWAGCLGAVDDYFAFNPNPEYHNPGVFIGNYSASSQSLVLKAGNFTAGIPEIVQLRSNRPAYPEQTGLVTTDGTVLITMAIWRPENVTEPIPIIVDAGPYYEIGSSCPVAVGPGQPCPVPTVDDTIDYPGQLTPFSLKNFLPHGYAVVQLAVRGTGTSGGCMDLLGQDEKHDLDQAITWLGEQPWSNGNVAMWGVSYDGSTPWEVAAAGNKHLKTIVPISGLPSIFDLMFRNGSAETRGAIMHATQTGVTPGVYWGYGFSDGFLGLPPDSPVEPPIPLPVAPPDWMYNPLGGQANGREQYQDLQNLLCPAAIKGQTLGQVAIKTGGRESEVDAYWNERDHRQAVLDNYKGSVFLIHGLQDWNVDPHSAIPFNAALRAKGLEVKEWYGQWDHTTPDGSCTVAAVPDWVTLPCRLDFAEVLFRWFERELKGKSHIDVGPSIQIQDNMGQWRNADSFPPKNAEVLPFYLTPDGALAEKPAGSSMAVRLMPQSGRAPAQIVELLSEPVAADLYISGMPTLQLPFKAYGEGGHIGVWMFDQNADDKVRAPTHCPSGTPLPLPCDPYDWRAAGIPVVGHAQMNLLYYAGGEQRQVLRPDQTYTAQVEFEPLDILVPKGHRVVIWIFQYQYGDHQASGTPAPVDIFLGGPGAVLNLPSIKVDAKTLFPVPGAHFPARDLIWKMYVSKPVFPSGGGLPPVPTSTPAEMQVPARETCVVPAPSVPLKPANACSSR